MKNLRSLAAFASLVMSMILLAPVHAQTPRAAAARPKPPVQAVSPAPVLAVAEQKCLRALNGACTNATSVEAARLRAVIIPAVRVSYFGTPAGTIGGDYIPFERLFQDNPLLFGLPTFTFVQPCCVTRTR